MVLTQEDLDKINELLINLRSDFFDRIDPILKEVQDNRQERIIVTAKLTDHEERIEHLEQKLHD